MAKITITLEDGDGSHKGFVTCKTEPSFETLLRRASTGHYVTPAEAYAMLALREIRAAAKQNGSAGLPKPRLIM